ncbi:MAG: D-amino-acid dehydrogenase [Pseudomonadota bacterium]|nr:D-amino acid dehydrogenase [Rubrivivax sp.]
MRAIVVGAGIVGVTTAYELASQGHEVTVFERRAAVAAEGSFANAGVLAPGYVTPWAAPGMSAKVLRQMLGRHAAVRFDGLSALAQLPWMLRWRLACRPRVYAANRGAMVRLARFSQERLLELTRRLALDYEQQPGYLVLLRGARELHAAERTTRLLAELGVAHELVDAERCRRLEPGLNARAPLAGAIHLAQDGVGNCRQFAHLIKAEAQRLGASFRFDSDVLAIEPGRPAALRTADGQHHRADAVVVCAGVHANRLLAPLGLALPLAPVYGYSITAPLAQRDDQPCTGPRAALMDERFKVAISRLGQRVRVAGSAEIGGSAERLNPAPLATLYKVLEDWFPGAAVVHEAQQWKGARPMLPDGPPVLGASGQPGLWLNLGHGSSGWMLACGSARVLAEAVSGRPAPIDLGSLQLARLR